MLFLKEESNNDFNSFNKNKDDQQSRVNIYCHIERKLYLWSTH